MWYQKGSRWRPRRTYHVQRSHCVGGDDDDGDADGDFGDAVVGEQGDDSPTPSRDARHARTYTLLDTILSIDTVSSHSFYLLSAEFNVLC